MLHVSFPCFLFLRIVFYFLTPKNSFLISWFSLNFPWLGNDILFTTQYFSYMRHTENIENSIFLILKKVINFVLGRRVTCHRIITSVGWGPWPTCPKIALSLYLVKYAFSPISLLLFIFIYIYIYIYNFNICHSRYNNYFLLSDQDTNFLFDNKKIFTNWVNWNLLSPTLFVKKQLYWCTLWLSVFNFVSFYQGKCLFYTYMLHSLF